MQFQHYYDAFQNIHGNLHTNNLRQECDIHIAPETIKEIIVSLLYPSSHERSFYLNACITRKYDRYGSFSLLEGCIHKITLHEFVQQDVDVRIFKNIEYELKDEKTRNCVDLIIERIKVHTFMDYFKIKYLPKYMKHSQNARWLYSLFCQCRNTFLVGIILSLVEFTKNYTLKP